MANNINDYINAYSLAIVPKPKKRNLRWLGDFAVNVLAYCGIIFGTMIFLGVVCHWFGC